MRFNIKHYYLTLNSIKIFNHKEPKQIQVTLNFYGIFCGIRIIKVAVCLASVNKWVGVHWYAGVQNTTQDAIKYGNTLRIYPYFFLPVAIVTLTVT